MRVIGLRISESSTLEDVVLILRPRRFQNFFIVIAAVLTQDPVSPYLKVELYLFILIEAALMYADKLYADKLLLACFVLGFLAGLLCVPFSSISSTDSDVCVAGGFALELRTELPPPSSPLPHLYSQLTHPMTQSNCPTPNKKTVESL